MSISTASNRPAGGQARRPAPVAGHFDLRARARQQLAGDLLVHRVVLATSRRRPASGRASACSHRGAGGVRAQPRHRVAQHPP
jgi:hypothetical protein